MFEIIINDGKYFKRIKTTYTGGVWYYSKVPYICHVWTMVCTGYMNLSVAQGKLSQRLRTKPKQCVLTLILAWESSYTM
jgi:hypothetical protein